MENKKDTGDQTQMIYATDVETYKQGEGELIPELNARNYTIGAIIGDEHHKATFYTDRQSHQKAIQAIIEANDKRNKITYIYGWNVEYDYISIYNDCLANSPWTQLSSKPFIYYQQHNGRTTAYLIDAMNFYPMSLKDASQIIGQEKKELPQNPKTTEEIKPYLEHDTYLTYKLIKHMTELTKLLNNQTRKYLTIAQVSMSMFLNYIHKNNLDGLITWRGKSIKSAYYKTLRKAYKGARTEAFQTGKHEKATMIDVNSLYPYILSTMNVPDMKTERYLRNPETSLAINLINKYEGIISCTIYSPEQQLPYLPVHYRKMLIYPKNATLTATWTCKDIREALKHGYELKEVTLLIIYDTLKVNPFTQYIREMYQKRLELPQTQKKTIKMLMNALGSKFSQHRDLEEYKYINRDEVEYYESEGWKWNGAVDSQYLMTRKITDQQPRYGNPLISAQMTAYSRAFMYKEMQKIPYNDLLYTDTDSIIFTGNHLDKFTIGTELGQFKIEQQGTYNALGEKDYYIAEAVKISGLPKRYHTKELIDAKQTIEVQKMIGLQSASKRQRYDLAGTFYTTKHELQLGIKQYHIYPEEIIDEKELATQEKPGN